MTYQPKANRTKERMILIVRNPEIHWNWHEIRTLPDEVTDTELDEAVRKCVQKYYPGLLMWTKYYPDSKYGVAEHKFGISVAVFMCIWPSTVERG